MTEDMIIARFLTQSRNVQRDAAVYNMVASILNSFQSVIFLVVLTRVVGTEESGIFSIAFAYSYMFLTIGKYGMRHYQVSDRNEEFSFRLYRLSRWISIAVMLVTAAVYIGVVGIHNGYSPRKFGIMLWMCLFRVPDAVEDVYYGMYQHRNRLDIAAKAMTLRMVMEISCYLWALIVLKDQYLALIIATVFNFAVLYWILRCTSRFFANEPLRRPVVESKGNTRGLLLLLKNCFPLFLGSFLTIYVTNAPKYAIDASLSDELQAYYGYLSMPVSMIGLLGGFLFIPLLYEFTELWNNGRIREFCRKFAGMAFAVTLITVCCIAAAAVLGIPVLSILFNADLTSYRKDLLILLAGGGFSALAALINAMVTVMRRQNGLLIGYIVSAVLAYAVSGIAVETDGIRGASFLFLLLMGIQCVCFGAVMFRGICRKRGEEFLSA